jgi:hypothetical protein
VTVGVAGLGTLIPTHVIARHSASFTAGLHTALLVGAAIALAGAIAAWVLLSARAVTHDAA